VIELLINALFHATERPVRQKVRYNIDEQRAAESVRKRRVTVPNLPELLRPSTTRVEKQIANIRTPGMLSW